MSFESTVTCYEANNTAFISNVSAPCYIIRKTCLWVKLVSQGAIETLYRVRLVIYDPAIL